MNRRNFLRALVPAIVAPVALVELLAPKRTIFLPPRGGWPTPLFLTNYVDPQLLEYLMRPMVCRMIDETDAQLRDRMLNRINYAEVEQRVQAQWVVRGY